MRLCPQTTSQVFHGRSRRSQRVPRQRESFVCLHSPGLGLARSREFFLLQPSAGSSPAPGPRWQPAPPPFAAASTSEGAIKLDGFNPLPRGPEPNARLAGDPLVSHRRAINAPTLPMKLDYRGSTRNAISCSTRRPRDVGPSVGLGDVAPSPRDRAIAARNGRELKVATRKWNWNDDAAGTDRLRGGYPIDFILPRTPGPNAPSPARNREDRRVPAVPPLARIAIDGFRWVLDALGPREDRRTFGAARSGTRGLRRTLGGAAASAKMTIARR